MVGPRIGEETMKPSGTRVRIWNANPITIEEKTGIA
jgi:hypothetical protein